MGRDILGCSFGGNTLEGEVMFYVGQKVVCINDDGMLGHKLAAKVSSLPVRGSIYTVRDVVSPDEISPCLGLLLEEIIGEIHPGWHEEYGFRSDRFRPIVERKTDISIFAEMPKPAKVSA